MKSSRGRIWSVIGTILVVVMLTSLFPSVALAGGSPDVKTITIDIGDPDSEAGHRLRGWGPIEGADNRGGYGGVDNCRVTWEAGDPDSRRYRSASFLIKMPRGYKATTLQLEVLDGRADDSFVVYVGCRKVYSYEGDQNDEENWKTHEIDLSRRCHFFSRYLPVIIKATGPAWSGFDTWGQLAVDEVTLTCEKQCISRCRCR